MKKVDIVTYCEWNSYGSILQAWALKTHLVSLGCEVNHLRLDSISSKKIKLYFKGKNIKTLIINMNRFWNRRKLQRRFDLTMQFFSEHFRFIPYLDYEQLKADVPEADVYIAGSDQIWNPNSINPFFYLSFVKDSRKKISYAASMGISKIPDHQRDEWYRAVQSFGHISVREEIVKEIINKEIDKEVLVHLDPTFLVDKEIWRAISKPYLVREPYILVYALFWDKMLNSQLKALHQKTGLQIVAITSQPQQVYAHRKIYDASVQEFLWLFDHASYIVTSSFHGVAFSIIFEKKFSAVINPQKPSRLNEVLNVLEIANTSINLLPESQGPNYTKVNDIIREEKEKANAYLCRGINLE